MNYECPRISLFLFFQVLYSCSCNHSRNGKAVIKMFAHEQFIILVYTAIKAVLHVNHQASVFQFQPYSFFFACTLIHRQNIWQIRSTHTQAMPHPSRICVASPTEFLTFFLSSFLYFFFSLTSLFPKAYFITFQGYKLYIKL